MAAQSATGGDGLPLGQAAEPAALYNVTFNETGLPPGTAWNVTVNTTTVQTTANNTTFQLPDGPYTYAIGSVPSFLAPSPGGGSFTVAGAAIWIDVTYTACSVNGAAEVAGYPYFYVPLGNTAHWNWTVLSLGTCTVQWVVQFPDFEAPPDASPPILTAYSVPVPPDTWGYIEVNVTMPDNPNDAGLYWHGIMGANPEFTCSVSGGACIVPGVAKYIYIYGEAAYNVTFNETGLPAGTDWTVTTNSSLTPRSVGSTDSKMALLLGNDTYGYVATAPGYGTVSGSFTVNGAPLTIPVPFCKAQDCKVTFIETGLPSGTPWQVTANGTTETSTTSRISFELPDGAYSYSISGVPGYHLSSYAGQFVVLGTALKLSVPFAQSVYSVKFDETGLHLAWGTPWCVTFNTVEKCADAATLTFGGIPNGTYAYAVSPVVNYSLDSPAAGTVSVAGTSPGALADTVSVTWELVTYGVAFKETGLPSGASWKVTLGAHHGSSTGSRIEILVSNGTYVFTAASAGYTANPSAGSVTVDGGRVTVSIHFTPVPSSVPVRPPAAKEFAATATPLAGRW